MFIYIYVYIYTCAELLSHIVVLFSVLENLLHCFLHSGCTNNCQSSPFSISLPTFVICVLFDDSHSHRCEMISHCGFDLHYLMITDVDRLFMWMLTIFILSLEKCLVGSSTYFLISLFVFLMLNCMNCLFMLYINLLSVILFANIFSHSVGCLFILSVVSFALQKLLNFTRSHLFIFAFISFALGDRFPQNIAPIYVKECSAYVFL